MPDLAESLGVEATETETAIETTQAATIPVDAPEQTTEEAAPFMVRVEGRPEGLPDAYWNDETKEIRVGSLVKSLTDTQTELRNNKPEAPETYAVELDEEATKLLVGDGKAEDDPVLKMAMEWAKEKGISQDAFTDLVQRFGGVAKELNGNQPTQTEKVEQLLATLKPAYGSDERVKAAVNGLSNFINTAIPEENGVREAAVAFAQTPEGFAAMDAIRNQTKDRIVPTTADATPRISPQEEYRDLATKQAAGTITSAELRRKNEVQQVLDQNDLNGQQQSVVATIPVQ